MYTQHHLPTHHLLATLGPHAGVMHDAPCWSNRSLISHEWEQGTIGQVTTWDSIRNTRAEGCKAPSKLQTGRWCSRSLGFDTLVFGLHLLNYLATISPSILLQILGIHWSMMGRFPSSMVCFFPYMVSLCAINLYTLGNIVVFLPLCVGLVVHVCMICVPHFLMVAG